jgi:cytochrome c556
VSLAIVAASVVVSGASVGLAQTRQYPIFTADHLNSAMKTVGLAFNLVGHSIEKRDPELAKDYLARARDQLATTITFWRDRKAEEAITILRDALKKMDALDTAMSVDKDKVDMSAVAELSKQVSASCEACHARYREQDPVSKEYRVKAELLKP